MYSASMLIVGLLPGAERPGIAIILPGVKGDTLLLDVGANIDPRPLHMLQYAIMGEVYMRCVMGRTRPTAVNMAPCIICPFCIMSQTPIPVATAASAVAAIAMFLAWA